MFISPRVVHKGYFALMASTPSALQGAQGEGVLAQASVQGHDPHCNETDTSIAQKINDALPVDPALNFVIAYNSA